MSNSNSLNVLPHSIPGTLNRQNQTAFDWGWQDLIAYGSHSLVVVVDPHTVQCLQTLAHHKASIIKVSWAVDRFHRNLSSPYRLRLASVDHTSECVIWDVSQGTVMTEFSLGNKPLVDLQWMETNDLCRDLLAVMLLTGVMTIWNAEKGTRISRFTFSENIIAFIFNPFQTENLVLQSADCFIFVEDFHPSRNPSTGGKKFYLTSEVVPSFFKGSGSTRRNVDPRLQQRLISGDNLQGRETHSLSDCLQICFSRASRHHLFLLYSREIIILDTDLKQTVGVVPSERNSSPFHQILPCQQRDVLYCLHENGCISVRIHHKVSLPNVLPTSPLQPQQHEIHYDLHGHSEALRISKTCQVFSGALCPSSELQVAILTSEGRVLIWQVEFQQVGTFSGGYSQEFDITNDPLPILLTPRPVKTLKIVTVGEEWEEEEEEDECSVETRGARTLTYSIAPHWFAPPNSCSSEYGLLSLKLTLGQLWMGLPSLPTSVRMCPALTTKNWLYYAPLVAMGMANGSLLVYNLLSRQILKVFSVHNCPVRGIEWVHQSSFISFAYSAPTSAGVRSEVAVINILTGCVTYLRRPDVPDDALTTPIDTIKISPLKHYLVVKYRDKPLQFWDLKTLTFLREMVSNPPSFSCIEWTPTVHRSKSKADYISGLPMPTVDFDMAMGADSKMAQAPAKEMLTVMDVYGCMWQISIEGSKVKVVHNTPTQTYLNSPTCVTWKNSLLAAGDSDGFMYVHDSKTSQMFDNPRAVVQKIRFAPGKGNSKLLVLYNARLDIRDHLSGELISQLRWGPKETGGVVVEDVDWATSDKTVVAASDGSMRIFDLSFQICHSSFTMTEFKDAVFCPHAAPAVSSLRLKNTLVHQPWRTSYSLHPQDHESENGNEVEESFRVQLGLLSHEWCETLLEAPLGTPQRALFTAHIYGDKCEIDFWSISLHYLLREKIRMQDPRYSVYRSSQMRSFTSDLIHLSSASATTNSAGHNSEDLLGPLDSDSLMADNTGSLSSLSNFDLSDRDVVAVLQECDLQTLEAMPPLDLCWDLLCDPELFKCVQLERVALLDVKRSSNEETSKCSELLLLLGQTDRSVQLLLEADTSSPDYYNSALKACLAATIRSSGATQSTIKLVATNLIANSRLMDGVELLCLIDKQEDACRYLQTYGEWHHSVWLAKAMLKEKECADVFSKWVEYLISVNINQKTKALLVLLSLGHFIKVLEMLYSMRHFDQAAMFAESCLEYRVLHMTDETTPLFHVVFLEYARHLLALGHYRGFSHYCSKAGVKGAQLLEDYFKQRTSSTLYSPNPTTTPDSSSSPSLLLDCVA